MRLDENRSWLAGILVSSNVTVNCYIYADAWEIQVSQMFKISESAQYKTRHSINFYQHVCWFRLLPVLHDEVVAADCLSKEQVASSALATKFFCISGIKQREVWLTRCFFEIKEKKNTIHFNTHIHLATNQTVIMLYNLKVYHSL